jgi:hypothetical protein
LGIIKAKVDDPEEDEELMDKGDTVEEVMEVNAGAGG